MCSLASTYHCIENASDYWRQGLFGGQGEGVAALLDHLAHLADAFGALGLALVARKDVTRTAGAGLNGLGDITLAETVTVAEVHEELHVSLTENGSL